MSRANMFARRQVTFSNKSLVIPGIFRNIYLELDPGFKMINVGKIILGFDEATVLPHCWKFSQFVKMKPVFGIFDGATATR